MNHKKIFRKNLYIILVIIFLAIIAILEFKSNKPFESIGGILILYGSVTALIRSYNLENYLLLQDNEEKITFIQHVKGMYISLFNMNAQKPMVLYMLIKPIFKKGDFETLRKKINLFTYITYVLIILAIVIGNLGSD